MKVERYSNSRDDTSAALSVTTLPWCPGTPQQQPNPHRSANKPTDKHQYPFRKSSCHRNHTKKTIPFSPLLRIRSICSTDRFIDQRSKELVNYLVKRGYSRPSLQRPVTRLGAILCHETLKQQEHTNSTTDRTPFVITFNPALYKVCSVVKKQLNILP